MKTFLNQARLILLSCLLLKCNYLRYRWTPHHIPMVWLAYSGNVNPKVQQHDCEIFCFSLLSLEWCMSCRKFFLSLIDSIVKYLQTTTRGSSIWSYLKINQHDRNCILFFGRCRMTSGKIQLQRLIVHFKTSNS